MTKTNFEGLKVGLLLTNIKTSKVWIVTDLISEYSSVGKSSPDVFKVRLSNNAGKSQSVSVDSIRKNYKW
jgi:hypothetical protein